MKFKKPKFWDLKKNSIISLLLLPLSFPFVISNFFLKFKKKKKNDLIKTICIGNIYLGGTGKTPTTLKIFEILKELKFTVSTGKKINISQHDENIILDKKTNLIIGKNRKEILDKAIELKKDIIVFDDGLQDKHLSYDIEFVCFDAKNFIGNGNLIPSGPLREKVESLKKYDGVFIKNDNENLNDQINLIKKINPKIEIFETYLKINNLENFNMNDNYLIFSGIGNPQNFRDILKKNKFKIKKEIIFPDHHQYNENEINDIVNYSKKNNTKIITTEKDHVKISKIDSSNINFVEVKLKIKDEERLKIFINKKINE